MPAERDLDRSDLDRSDPDRSDPDRSVCPACGGTLVPWRSARVAEPSLLTAHVPLARCTRCGTAVTTGAPVPQLHDSGAYGGDPRLHRLVAPLLRAFDRQRLSLLAEVARPGARLLDAGAGRGRFVLAARAAGYNAFGLEPSTRGVQAAVRAGAPVQQVTIEQAELPAASLDVVTLWHVLEHLDDPGAALGRIAGWLRPRGALLVGVPNLDSLQARIGAGCWYHLDVPRHRVHFTPGGVHELLRRSGFTERNTHHLLLEHNPFGMWQSLVNRVTHNPSYLYNLLKRNAPVRSPDLALTLLAMPLLPVAAVLELAAGSVGRGGTIAVLAQRQS